ncbi:hypothetical protein [Sphingomonas crocodyli]|uniref:Cycloisomerase n=1 Tax=Sphingomonas crocodyli TaxID=1979270 RepID=A0A437M0S7_9SPHN|nr:hypothetical protein [Sphingomonas crocodyli]RVT91175.1 hypothetical protein EOD43_16805 [Sphingomonas crocodyli]
MRIIALAFALLSATPAIAADTPPAVTETFRMKAEEAHQGVVADKRYIYAISNAEIGKYDRKTGQRVARWQGDPKLFVHMNSCILDRAMLICAASNYPQVPQASSIEWFDTRKMAHVKTRSLGPQRGSLTWLDWHDGSWWAAFANYDNKGGEPARDHKLTTLVRYTPDFTEQGAWLFPPAVLDRFAPYSTSGGAWGEDGLLYVTGHDRPELYAVRLPEAGSTLIHVATIGLVTNGQAIAWEKGGAKRTLWSISRAGSEVVAATVPGVTR